MTRAPGARDDMPGDEAPGSGPPVGDPPDGDPLRRLDDPDFPALTMSQAADLLGVQAAFLRSLDGAGALQPHRSPGGHRRYSRQQLAVAARLRGLLDEGHTLASAEVILGLQDELADTRADRERLRADREQLRATVDRLRAGTEPGPPAQE